MFRASIYRMTVQTERAAEFEAEARHQLQVVSEREPGTMLYGFFKRIGPASSILPSVPNNLTEYIHLMAYQDEAAQQLHLDIEHNPEAEWAWGRVFRTFMAAPLISERFEAPDIVTGITRDRSWDPTQMHRFAFFRFKVQEGKGEEFEEQAKKQIAMVTENEPGTVLYTFCRRSPDGSALLPKSPRSHPEYLHLMAYVDEAAQQRHREIEFRTEGWAWGPVFQSYLEAPLENESFAAEQLVTGITRNASW